MVSRTLRKSQDDLRLSPIHGSLRFTGISACFALNSARLGCPPYWVTSLRLAPVRLPESCEHHVCFFTAVFCHQLEKIDLLNSTGWKLIAIIMNVGVKRRFFYFASSSIITSDLAGFMHALPRSLPIQPDDIEISHKLNARNNPVIAKFLSH